MTDEDLVQARAAGLDDGRIVAIVALTAQISLTNFLNNVADTEVDFPALD